MSQIIRNRIILIQGHPGEGKSYLAHMIACSYQRIYANMSMKDKYGKEICNRITNIDDLKTLEFSPIKGVCILDEGGVNINARDSQSSGNRDFGELGMLGRKLNVDIIICAQLGRMVDVYFRELANYRFEMHAWFEKKDYLMFEAKIYAHGDTVHKVTRFDLFEFTRLTGNTYNTLETSRIDKKSKIRERSEDPKMRVLVSGEAAKNDYVTDRAPLWSTDADKYTGRL